MAGGALELDGVSVSYGASPALREVSVTAPGVGIVAIIGPNGAGKTTLLRAASRMVGLRSGRVRLDGRDVTRKRPDGVVRLGLAHCPEGRRLFGPLTVRANLELGAYVRRWTAGSKDMQAALSRVYDMFPVLHDRSEQRAGSLSGGEQQMLAIGRALMSDPRMILLDEPSLGLAPIMVERIYRAIQALRDQGLAVLLVEQDASIALEVSDTGYVLQGGRVALSGPSAELRANPLTHDLLIGVVETR